ncbi:MAG: sialate O-acetylesterase [Lentisphaerales bacterium]|nr:sialate O-acetylesterase [Lentisphaerales bacterium]
MKYLLILFVVAFNTSCVTAKEEPMHIFLLIGQSNMAGRAKLEAGDDKIIENCMLWNGESWEAAKAPLNRYSKFKKSPPKFIQGVSPGVEFVKGYMKANPGVKVGIISGARGGSKIEEWHPTFDKWTLYKEAVKQTHAALAAGGELKGILWHQGESNSKVADEYPAKLKAHIESLRKEFGKPKLAFVFGQIGQWRDDYKPFNEMIVQQTKLIPNTSCVTTEGLSSFDPYHFDRKSQLELGRRYAAEMLKLF